MMIMQNTNRLINDFKKQTKTTIWKHLDAMAANYAVYSTHLKGMTPFLTNYDIYLYCYAANVVILCLDCCGHNDEQIYAESELISSLIFEDGCEPRVSPVWRLSKAVNLAQKRLQERIPDINVYGVLLTEADILNSELLDDLWDAHHFMVIDELTRLKYKNIHVNEDTDVDYRDYVMTILDEMPHMITAEKPSIMGSTLNEKSDDNVPKYDDDDEFDKLLDQYLKEGMEVVEEEAEEDNEEEIPIPDGDIEQNQNVSVKVEILRPIANPQDELDKLVGCDNIKQRMEELVALTSFNKMMQEYYPNCKQHHVSLHSVFLGRPGTGKTTVCKIFGSLLRQAGALSKGHVVICDRGTFIGTLWGDEERSMRQVLEKAQGGVLMIDEAYLLNGKHENDPGKLVIQLLMNVLADETQRDIAVVLCGYKEPMMKLLDSNPGLYSRFPNKFEFTDFTVDELLEITKRRLKEYDYRFTSPAWEKYSGMLSQAYRVRNPETWGNARFVANQLEHIYIQHAARCIKQRPNDKRDLLMITPEDIQPIEVPRQIAKIGF